MHQKKQQQLNPIFVLVMSLKTQMQLYFKDIIMLKMLHMSMLSFHLKLTLLFFYLREQNGFIK